MSISSDKNRPTVNILNWQDLENKIIACRLCPRLVSWREEVARDAAARLQGPGILG